MQKYRNTTHLQIISAADMEESEEEIDIEETELSVDFLLNLIQQLPDRYRLVFNLYVLDKYAHKEIAKMLQISEGTSKSNLSRARKTLKIQIEIHQEKSKKA